jgi:molybdopterin-guanine dinucleotide biosynthesis protein A
MGRDKNFVEIEGEALLTRVCRRCATFAPVWVVARPGQRLPAIGAAARVQDELRGDGLAGPLLGIASGLGELQRRGIELALIAGCDDVAVEGPALRARLDVLLAAPGVTGACLQSEGFVQPLSAAVRVDPALARARQLLDAGNTRASAWAANFEKIDDPAAGRVWDLDTPEQLQEWLSGGTIAD